jgi:predicted heme/steroid binding protein
MNLAELANYDGREGRPAYIAVNGTIYDVTNSPLWKDGLHPPDHRAGQDMTDELSKAPHVRSVVERFPVVGSLAEESTEPSAGGGKITLGIIIAVVIVVLAVFIIL